MLVVRVGDVVKDRRPPKAAALRAVLDNITNTNKPASKRSRPPTDQSLMNVLTPEFPWTPGPSPPEQLAHDLGGVVHHGDDAGVVQPRRADHAEHADDAAGGVVIGRHDGRGTGQREQ